MTNIIILFFQDIIADGFKLITEYLTTHTSDMAFYAENYIGTLSSKTIQNLFGVAKGYALNLLIVKFMWRGFCVYILETTGDPENSPLGMLVSYIKALIVMICFPTIYDFIVQLTKEVLNSFLNELSKNDISTLDTQTIIEDAVNGGPIFTIILLIFVVLIGVSFFKFMKMGVELMILRVGIAFACINLIDSDPQKFNNYTNVILKTMFTIMIQVIAINLAITLLVGADLMWGVVFGLIALSTPKIISEFIIPSQGGNMTNQVYSGARLISMGKSLIGK